MPQNSRLLNTGDIPGILILCEYVYVALHHQTPEILMFWKSDICLRKLICKSDKKCLHYKRSLICKQWTKWRIIFVHTLTSIMKESPPPPAPSPENPIFCIAVQYAGMKHFTTWYAISIDCPVYTRGSSSAAWCLDEGCLHKRYLHTCKQHTVPIFHTEMPFLQQQRKKHINCQFKIRHQPWSSWLSVFARPFISIMFVFLF